MYTALLQELDTLTNHEKGSFLSRFFKTGKGEYGEGDIFIGLVVPVSRALSKKYKALPLPDVIKLLQSKIHEHRVIALFILIEQYKKADATSKKEIIELYLKYRSHINNWDLVDLSAPYLLGDYLLEHDRSILYKLVKSDVLWDRRIAVLSSFAFIKNNQFDDTLSLAEMLLTDTHDLMHKAVGWMLREIGKRDLAVEKKFLDAHCTSMPRTMLRYAIERFEEPERLYYLNLKK